jgi:DNA-binding response OmpR family regulator
MMPEMDGLSLAREIRLINPDIPIIFLTAKNQKEDIIEGFKSGADDYITKPFSMEELLYRIEAILRRTTNPVINKKAEAYIIGDYTFDPLKQMLVFKDKSIKLTTKESELLELLCQRSNEILERNYALKTIWIDDNYFNARSMDVYITRLRKYLREDPSVKILNVHGRGYKLIS